MNESLSAFTGDSDVLVTELIMLRTRYPRKTFLLVEGSDDESVYERFTSDNCLIQVCDGKSQLVKTVQTLNQNKLLKGYLAIRDADFDKIESKIIEPNIFLTDCHDLETVIFCSGAFDSFVRIKLRKELHKTMKSESNRNERRNELINELIAEIRIKLFNISAILGYIMWVSEKYSWGIKASDIVKSLLDQNLNKETLELNLFDSVTYLKQKCIIPDETKYKDTEFSELKLSHLYHLSFNGHYLFHIFSTYIFKSVTKKYLKEEIKPGGDVNTALLASYDYEMFKSTQLFVDVRNWEAQNAPFEVFR